MTDRQIVREDELGQVAKELIKFSQGAKIWLFSGSMGSGKTTLISHLCRYLKVNSVVNSPTFSIVNEYSGRQESIIYHFDFYRLKGEEEAYDIGLEEYFDSGAYCFVEWPERVNSFLPSGCFKIVVQEHTPLTRYIHYYFV